MMKLKKKIERGWRTKMKKKIKQNILNWHKMMKLKKIKEKKKHYSFWIVKWWKHNCSCFLNIFYIYQKLNCS